MQTILSIDLTGRDAQAVVLAVEGRTCRVLAKHSEPLNGHFRPVPAAAGAQAADEEQRSAAQPIIRLLDRVAPVWNSSVLLIPPDDYFSMHLQLPFGDERNIRKVIDLEVQDLIPFDIDEFLVQHRAMGALPDRTFDVHVSLIPKARLQALLRICREAKFDPMVVSTPSGALGGCYQLAPEFLDPDSAVICVRESYCHLCVCFDGKVYADRVIRCGPLESERSRQALFTELKLTLAAHEQRQARTFSRVYLLGRPFPEKDLQHSLGRNVEAVEAAQFVSAADQDSALAALAGIFVRDLNPPLLLTNFRTREFAYRPQLKELFRGARLLLPYLCAFLFLAVALAAVSYGLRARRIHATEQALRDEIARVLPDLKAPDASIYSVNERNKRLEAELKDLGSPSEITPLEAFALVSEDLARAAKDIPEMGVTSLLVDSSWITVELDTPDYKDGERIEKLFKAKRQKDAFCKVEREDLGRSGLSAKKFRFKVRLCER